MATKDIAIACQGGGSHAAFTGGVLPVLLGEFDNISVARSGRGLAYREPGIENGAETPVLVAISGTSGGAISALLGWYGFITGGAPEARRSLDDFWYRNSAIRYTEWGLNHVFRAMGDMAGMWGLDIKTSPYGFPMYGFEMFNTSAWPQIARMLGKDNPWMRPDYFALPQLLRPCVDWPLIAAMGDFAGIPLDVQRWLRSDLEAAMFAPDAPCQQRYRADRAAIEDGIRRKIDAVQVVRARMEELGIGDDSLLHAAYARWQPPALRFDHDSLAALAKAVQMVTQCIPNLLIGAVELHQGDFIAFSSERSPEDGGISLDAVLASASVPWLFRAHEMPGTDPNTLAPRQLVLWDGLFSQNPPIKNFLAGVLDDAKKPDEIWVVQINPNQAKAEAATKPGFERIVMSGGEIWDLRNALAGNLALNQELGFVESINRRMEAEQSAAEHAALPDGEAHDGMGDGHANGDVDGVGAAAATPARRYDKLVQVDRIIMDSDAVEAATGLQLGANSKLDRDPQLKEALCAHGRVQARRYLALRRQVERLCGEFGQTLAGACGTTGGIAADDPDGERCRVTAGQGALLIDGATLYGQRKDDPAAPQALVRWRTVDARIHGRPVRIEGESELDDEAGASADWRLKEVRITAVAPRKVPTLAPASREMRLGYRPGRGGRTQ